MTLELGNYTDVGKEDTGDGVAGATEVEEGKTVILGKEKKGYFYSIFFS